MLWFPVFLLICAVISSYLFFAPFYLEINSIDDLFRIRFHHLASAGLLIADSSLKVDLSIAGWKRQIDLLAEPERKEKPARSKKKRKGWKISPHKIKAVIKSFKVKKFCLTIDTGNMPLNGMLYPVFYWLSKCMGKAIGINFINENEIVLEIENNLARVFRAFIFS